MQVKGQLDQDPGQSLQCLEGAGQYVGAYMPRQERLTGQKVSASSADRLELVKSLMGASAAAKLVAGWTGPVAPVA